MSLRNLKAIYRLHKCCTIHIETVYAVDRTPRTLGVGLRCGPDDVT